VRNRRLSSRSSPSSIDGGYARMATTKARMTSPSGDTKLYMQVLGREHSAPHLTGVCVCDYFISTYDSLTLGTLDSMNEDAARQRPFRSSSPGCVCIYSESLFPFSSKSNQGKATIRLVGTEYPPITRRRRWRLFRVQNSLRPPKWLHSDQVL
jgi:hypothetical protein